MTFSFVANFSNGPSFVYPTKGLYSLVKRLKINDTILINNIEWVISEHRIGRGREWKYTLSYEDTDGSYTTMSLNERAMDGLALSGGFIGSIDK